MRLSDLHTIVFDLDDTLYLEYDYVRSGFLAVGNYLRAEEGWSDHDATRLVQTCLADFHAGRRGDLFDRALNTFPVGRPRPSMEALVRTYRTHTPAIRLPPDARQLMANLAAHDNVWIITDGPLASQRAKVNALQLSRYVRRVIFNDARGRAFWKPHQGSFLQVQRVSASRPRDCIYIADNPAKDFIAPRQLGWSTLRIRRPGGLYSDNEAAKGQEADAEIRSLWPLCRWSPQPLARRAA